jgi:hypothetical protein
MKKIIIVALLLMANYTYSQFFQEITYGLFAGANNSKLDDIENTLIVQGIYTGYSTEEKASYGLTAGCFINWKNDYESKFSIEAEAAYSKRTSEFLYEDIRELKYTMRFDYNYLDLGVLFKFYPVPNLYLGAGPSVALNLSPDNLSYSSNGDTVDNGVSYDADSVVQSTLRESLGGLDYFMISTGLGYEFSNNILIGFRYNFGLSDALETKENGFRYSETQNIMHSFNFRIGYRFRFDDSKNFQ